MKKQIRDLRKGNKCWFFYRIKGIYIENQLEWRDFIFNDATIVNNLQLADYLEEDEDFDKLSLPYEDLRKGEHCFLIVELNGRMNDDNQNEYKQRAKKRALEVISFFFTTILFYSDYNIKICLESEIYEHKNVIEFYQTNTKRYGQTHTFTKGEYTTINPSAPFKYKRDDLVGLFNRDIFKNLYHIVAKSSNEHILISLVHFYLTANVFPPSTQLLGAVTSIELLLLDNAKHELAKKRIKLLLGEEYFNDLKLNNSDEGVFDKRNRIIHGGDSCNSTDAYRAIKLYVEVLINVTFLVKKFNFDKMKVIKHLDIINQIFTDVHLKSDYFNIGNSLIQFISDFPFRDWIVIRLIDYYGISEQLSIDEFLYKFTMTIAAYHEVKKISIDESYKIVCKFIYYNFELIPSYNDFVLYYENNFERIQNDLKYNRFIQGYKLSV